MPELPSLKWAPEDLHLSIEYEDADLVVINKPAGLVVHPGAGNGSGTLAIAILYRYPNTASLPRAGIVHRLDKDTSGLIVVALSERARGYLIQTLERREVVREYLAVVNGCPISGGNIDAPIGRHPRDRIKMADRIGLYDGILVKENHIRAAGSIENAINLALKNTKGVALVEIEVENLSEFSQALNAGAKRILLDNFSTAELKKAVGLNNGQAKLEASGNVNRQTIRAIADTGVNFISCGQITKDIKAVDLSLQFST